MQWEGEKYAKNSPRIKSTSANEQTKLKWPYFPSTAASHGETDVDFELIAISNPVKHLIIDLIL